MWCCFLCTFHCFLLLFTVFHCFPLLAAACDGNPAANLKANGHDVIPGQPMARASHILMANEGDLKRVQAQIAAGADFDQVDEFGRTADSVADEKGFTKTRDAVKEFAEAAK